jgi:hypothetical protein
VFGVAGGSYGRLFAKLAKLDLLAIDDWLLAPLTDAVLCENAIEGWPSETAWQTTPLWSRLARAVPRAAARSAQVLLPQIS